LRVNIAGDLAAVHFAFEFSDARGFFFVCARSAVICKAESAPFADDERSLSAIKIWVADNHRLRRYAVSFSGGKAVESRSPRSGIRRIDVRS